MTQEEIEEGNKLIAEFMSQFPGYQKHYHKVEKDYVYDNPNTAEALPIKNSSFHESWSWLMPVVEKIWEIIETRESLFYFDVSKFDKDIGTIYGDFITEESSNIIDCYDTVAAFIKWHNSQNQNYPEDTDSNTRI